MVVLYSNAKSKKTNWVGHRNFALDEELPGSTECYHFNN